ncbi:MAG: FAD-dependent oxidoreductase, partial [Spirochaetales bacterium]|nr:FAD-dependent oxidoreductase [Spirochaetales bacterium]
MDYDVIVIGGGHAGIEACLASARIGFKTLLVTQSLDAIGRLSCNPAVGGLAKGNIVREVDALGGQMGLLIDATMIQFRILNRRRGPAVQAPRAQADKFSYSRLAKETLEKQDNLSLFMDTVVDILTDSAGRKACGVLTQRGIRFTSRAVVLTTGTFMEGRIFIGEYDHSAGRLGEEAAIGLGTALRQKGFSVGRLKTGTPARVKFSSL